MSTSSPPRLSRSSEVLAYSVAILSVATAAAVALLLDNYLQTSPYASSVPCAIMFAAWWGGVGPAALATALPIPAFASAFVATFGTFDVVPYDTSRVILFIVAALFALELSVA